VACVVCEPLDDGHRYVAAPSVLDVLNSALRRGSNEVSATETFRTALDASDDFDSLRAALLEAYRQVAVMAGPDRSGEIERWRAQAARYARAVEATTAAERRVKRLSVDREGAHDELVKARQAEQTAAQKRGWLRGPDRHAQILARQVADNAGRRLRRLDEHLQQAERELTVARHDKDELQGTAQALQGAEAAQRARRSWLEANPDVVAHLTGLAHRARDSARLRSVVGPLSRPGPGRHPGLGTTFVPSGGVNHEYGHDPGLDL
jgi:hypothetical protein